jgi:hypothetical protein
MKKTKKAYEEHLNQLYAEYYSSEQAVDLFEYMTNKSRGAHTTPSNIVSCAENHTLGTLLRKYDPIAFNTGFSDWD